MEKYGQHLKPNQLIKMNDQIMVNAMMVNAQHLMYRTDIFKELGLEVPKNYDEVLEVAEKIKQSSVVEYPLGGIYKADWNLGEEFVNLYLGNGGEFFTEGRRPAINNETGIATLDMMKKLTEYMTPEYLTADSVYVNQQFQQGRIAMAVLWADSAGSLNDPGESRAVGKVGVAAAPNGKVRPASTLWWDGMVFAKNMSDEHAKWGFRWRWKVSTKK